jgi:hypothetical protein
MNPPSRNPSGRFDGNLYAYMLFFIQRKLSSALMDLAEDIRSEAALAMLTQPNLNAQLRRYIEKNEIPRGRDLSLLKAVLYRQRLKYIKHHGRHAALRLTGNESSPMEEEEAGDGDQTEGENS